MSAEHELLAIGPVDGRYRGKTSELAQYFSEFSYIKYRLLVEVEYFVALAAVLPQLAAFPVGVCAAGRTPALGA